MLVGKWNLGSTRLLCSGANAVGQKPFWSTSPKCALHHKRPRPSHSRPSAPNAAWKHREGRGVQEEGVPGSCPPSLSLQFRLAQLRLFLVFPTCAHWRVRSFSPLSPGGKRGTTEGERRKGGRQGRRCPTGPSHEGARGAQGPRIPPPSPLLSALLRGAAWPTGVQSTLLRGRPGAAHQSESRRDPRATHRSSRSPATAPPPRATSPRRRRGVAAAGVWSRHRLRCLQGNDQRAAPQQWQAGTAAQAARVRARACPPPGARSHAPRASEPRTRTPPRLAASASWRDAKLTPRLWAGSGGDLPCSRAERVGFPPCSHSPPTHPHSAALFRLRVLGRPGRRSVGHTLSPGLTARAPVQPGCPLSVASSPGPPSLPSPSPPPLRVWALLLLLLRSLPRHRLLFCSPGAPGRGLWPGPDSRGAPSFCLFLALGSLWPDLFWKQSLSVLFTLLANVSSPHSGLAKQVPCLMSSLKCDEQNTADGVEVGHRHRDCGRPALVWVDGSMTLPTVLRTWSMSQICLDLFPVWAQFLNDGIKSKCSSKPHPSS